MFERQLIPRAGLKYMFHLLNKTKPLRLGEVAVLSNALKPTQRVKESEETEEYVSNERTS